MPPAPSTTPQPSFRVGLGYDLHRLEPLAPAGKGRPLMLGGVRFEAPVVEGVAVGPVGHSDADAMLHAITDALLGAIGAPDIGQLFPDNDPRHESGDSRVFLEEAARRVRAAGYEIGNIDATVVLERPKLGPRKGEVRASIAAMLGLDASRVNVKGKTHERVDAVGEGRAVEAHAVALLIRA
ncbi:MAG: 2-C-methyl-D-erythritol 2,4-cyclodiphosphate synthase [Phycisphaerales bacterium]|nr:2-C-methyl-D-erythritol 2,4-cyclodiphosphate synthase [Phycisphaerales bacterium]MCB9841035.1 2-C-methyl-D-erythritol 2,4-cyclodiphosphate synthase [Phycisphaeraceae bacterium]